MQNTKIRSGDGFSLLEILVALVLIGLLVGTLLPSVLGQMGRGEANRIVEDLRAIENAAKTFRVDVNRWPGDLEDLATQISPTSATPPDTVFNSTTGYPAALVSRWEGPYLEGIVIANGGTLTTAAGGSITENFAVGTLNGATYLTVEVTGLETDAMEEVSEVIDGDTDLNAGRVQNSSGTLRYFAASVD